MVLCHHAAFEIRYLRASFLAMKTDPIIAYFDGLCPICVHEMKIYERRGGGRVILDDVNGDIPNDVDRKAALDALHVRLSDGTLVDGWAAFIAIWERCEGWGWLAILTRPAPIRIPLDALYRFIVPYRPRRKCADGACAID